MIQYYYYYHYHQYYYSILYLYHADKMRLLNIFMQLRKCCGHPYLFDGMTGMTAVEFIQVSDHLFGWDLAHNLGDLANKNYMSFLTRLPL